MSLPLNSNEELSFAPDLTEGAAHRAALKMPALKHKEIQ
jgi:hypothetical protein